MNTDLIAGHGMRSHRPGRLRRAAFAFAAVTAVTVVLAACGSGGPGVAHLGATAAPSASPGGSKSQNALAFAQCMRKQGITNFPDPGSGGGFRITGGLDPMSAQFQAAQNACKSLLPNGGAPNPAQQAAAQQAALQFSQCMRSHGIANFPDPQFQSGPRAGGTTLRLPSSIDPNSPQFKSAQSACQKLLPKPPAGDSVSGGGGPGGGSGTVIRGGS